MLFPVINNDNVYEYYIFNPIENRFTKSFSDKFINSKFANFCTLVSNEEDFITSAFNKTEHYMFLYKNNNVYKIKDTYNINPCYMFDMILPNNNILLISISPNNAKVSTMYIYPYIVDLNLKTMKRLAPLNSDIKDLDLGNLNSFKIVPISDTQFLSFIYDGNKKVNYITLYNVSSDLNNVKKIKTIKITKLNHGLSSGNITRLNNNEILITGGQNGLNIQCTWALKNAYIFQIKEMKLQKIVSMKNSYFNHSCLRIKDNTILLYGGRKDKIEVFQRF